MAGKFPLLGKSFDSYKAEKLVCIPAIAVFLSPDKIRTKLSNVRKKPQIVNGLKDLHFLPYLAYSKTLFISELIELNVVPLSSFTGAFNPRNDGTIV